MTAPLAAPPVTRTGNIYDLGYRRYEGPRLGRAHAVRSLVSHSFRTTFGIGRSGRAKIAPLTFGAMAVLPSVLIVGVLAIVARLGIDREVEGFGLVGFSTYFGAISAIIALFCAAQAPELFGRDQRHGVLPLYFARALRRSDYALARLAGFCLAVLVLLLLPMTILFLGRVLLSTDISEGFADNLPSVPPVLAQALTIAGLLGGMSMAVAAYAPRRAYATAGIIALFVLPGIVSSIIIELGSGTIGNLLVLLSPSSVIDGTNALFFGLDPDSGLFFFDFEQWTFLASAFVMIAAFVVLIVRRFARIAT
jgi:ABC-2 type transport system permease protein